MCYAGLGRARPHLAICCQESTTCGSPADTASSFCYLLYVNSLKTEVFPTGTSSQAGAGVMATALAIAANAPPQTYFERLVWRQASQAAAAAVAGKPVRYRAKMVDLL